MVNFGNIEVGTKFIFKGRFYIKTNETTGVSIQLNKQKIHFFTENENIEVDNKV